MPCLFLEDFPCYLKIDPEAAHTLYVEVAAAVGLPIDKVDVHLGNKQYQILQPNGTKVPAPDVHVFIEWTERSYNVKLLIVAAIHKFLSYHGLHSDITFRDSPKGTFFVDGVLIGSPPLEIEPLYPKRRFVVASHAMT